MGLFDTIEVKCEICKENMYFQSKTGDKMLKNYLIENAPIELLYGVYHNTTCKCGNIFELDINTKKPILLT